MKITVAADTDISDAVITGTENTRDADYTIDIATDADAITMTRAQHGLLGTVNDGADATITLSDAGAATGNANIGAYSLAAGDQTFTLGAASQNVTTSTGAIEVSTGSVADITDAAIDGTNATTLTVNIADDADISDAVITGTTGAQDTNYSIQIASQKDPTMTVAQNALISSALEALRCWKDIRR